MEVIYSNIQRVGHNRIEFWIDFHQLSPENLNLEKSEPLIRVYMNPEVVMGFGKALEKNIGGFINTYLKPKKKKEEGNDK